MTQQWYTMRWWMHTQVLQIDEFWELSKMRLGRDKSTAKEVWELTIADWQRASATVAREGRAKVPSLDVQSVKQEHKCSERALWYIGTRAKGPSPNLELLLHSASAN